MPIAHVVSGGAQGSGPVSSVTTAGLNTTGASLLVVTYARDSLFAAAATPISDSNSNTWTAATAEQGNAMATGFCRQFYAKNPTVGAGHTFTFTLTGAGFPSIGVSAFSSADTTAPLDQTATGTDSTSPFASPATGTLSQADEAVVGAYTDSSVAEGIAVAGAYTAGFVADGSATQEAIGHEWKIVSSTAAVTSEFTGANVDSADQVSTYKGAAAAAAQPYQPWMQRGPVLAQ